MEPELLELTIENLQERLAPRGLIEYAEQVYCDREAIIALCLHNNNFYFINWLNKEGYIADGEYSSEDGTTFHYKGGVLHRTNGPACIYPSGLLEFYYEGNLHNEAGPAYLPPVQSKDRPRWYLNGEEYIPENPSEEANLLKNPKELLRECIHLRALVDAQRKLITTFLEEKYNRTKEYYNMEQD